MSRLTPKGGQKTKKLGYGTNIHKPDARVCPIRTISGYQTQLPESTMRFRKRQSRKRAKRSFKKGLGVRKMNLSGRTMRGGTRL